MSAVYLMHRSDSFSLKTDDSGSDEDWTMKTIALMRTA
jgi:hypothetical protein